MERSATCGSKSSRNVSWHWESCCSCRPGHSCQERQGGLDSSGVSLQPPLPPTSAFDLAPYLRWAQRHKRRALPRDRGGWLFGSQLAPHPLCPPLWAVPSMGRTGTGEGTFRDNGPLTLPGPSHAVPVLPVPTKMALWYEGGEAERGSETTLGRKWERRTKKANLSEHLLYACTAVLST